MSTSLVSPEDYKFFDFLAPFRWPGKTKKQISNYRELVADGEIQIETLLENALVAQSKGAYTRIATKGRDFTDDSDSKKAVSQFRNNNIARGIWTNSCGISGLKNKIGLIRAVCYSKEQDRFYFFAIPNFMYSGMTRIDILLDQSTGYREPKGIPKGKWTACMLGSFTELATITPEEAEVLCRLKL